LGRDSACRHCSPGPLCSTCSSCGSFSRWGSKSSDSGTRCHLSQMRLGICDYTAYTSRLDPIVRVVRQHRRLAVLPISQLCPTLHLPSLKPSQKIPPYWVRLPTPLRQGTTRHRLQWRRGSEHPGRMSWLIGKGMALWRSEEWCSARIGITGRIIRRE
jgi:hypothetical protein